MRTQTTFASYIRNSLLAYCSISIRYRQHSDKRLLCPWILNKSCINIKYTAFLDKNDKLKKNAHLSIKNQLDWDSFGDLFGVGIDMEPRNIMFSRPEPRSWFGPNGQYVKELPCPSCRGRGYVLCRDCGMHRSSPTCPQCNGKGLSTCRQCLGECVIWEETIDELPWENAHTSSPINVVEDAEIDNMEIELAPKKKSKRVYASPPPDVSAKISHTLRSLNAATGMFSKRMKKVHSDPILHAQRVEAMKRAKRTSEAREHMSKKLKAFFSDPENRLQRSLSMKGVKFFCKNCGQEGHRRHYCPSLKDTLGRSWYTCRLCGEPGHNRKTCKQNKENRKPITHVCEICGQAGHSCKSCPQYNQAKTLTGLQKDQDHVTPKSADLKNNVNVFIHHTKKCSICRKEGHNARNCPHEMKLEHSKIQYNANKSRL